MNWSNFFWGLYYASMGSVLIPIVSYLLRKKKNRLHNIVLILLLASLVSDGGNLIYVILGHRGSLIHNIFFVCQLSLLCLIYSNMLRAKVVVKIVLLTFPLIALFYSVFFQSINEYQSIIWVIGDLLVISFALRHYWEMYYSISVDSLHTYFNGWINIAVFWYFSFNLFLFATANYVFHNESTAVAMVFWSFHNLNNIIKNCLFALGFWLGTETHSRP